MFKPLKFDCSMDPDKVAYNEFANSVDPDKVAYNEFANSVDPERWLIMNLQLVWIQ